MKTIMRARKGSFDLKLKYFLLKLGLLILGTLVFSLSQASSLLLNGLAPLAFFALLPYFVLAMICSIKESIIWGAVYGFVAQLFLVSWMYEFSVLAFIGIGVLYFILFAFLTPFIRIAYTVFKEYAFFALWILYMGYEFVKTSGFFAFSYGVIGYSQWQFLPLIQLASLFGVWAVSAILVFPSAFLAIPCVQYIEEGGKPKPLCFLQHIWTFIRSKRFIALAYVVVLLLSFLPYFMHRNVEEIHKKIALIQPNSDPWKSNYFTYEQDLDILIHLSEQALKADKDIDLIVWPETAFIPRIKWHYKFRTDHRMFTLVDKLLNYIDSRTVAFLIGNDEALYDASLPCATTDIEKGRVDYNAALLFVPKKNVIPPEPDVYYKQHLVPITESFPYKDVFPRIYELLQKADTHFYEKGVEATVFNFDDMFFSVPICFEDNFGYLTRNFVKATSNVNLLINISNDAWAKSEACLQQHLSNSVFRAVETALPVLRSTANGITCYINEKGKIVKSLPPFEQGFLIVDCKIPKTSNTLYVKIGDVLSYIFAIASVIVIFYSCIRLFFDRRKNG